VERFTRGADVIEAGAKLAFGIMLVDFVEESPKAGFLAAWPGALDTIGQAYNWNPLTLIE